MSSQNLKVSDDSVGGVPVVPVISQVSESGQPGPGPSKYSHRPSGQGQRQEQGQGQGQRKRKKKKNKKTRQNQRQGDGPLPRPPQVHNHNYKNGNGPQNSNANGRELRNGNGQPNYYKKNKWNNNEGWRKGGERTRKKRLLAQWNDHVPMRPIKRTCTRFIRGKCTNNTNNDGEPCVYAHFARRRSHLKCRFWAMESCRMGDKCSFTHIVPCKYYFLMKAAYHDFNKCRYSHEPLTEELRDLLIQDLELDLAPKVLYHDFKEPHGKQIKSDLLHKKPNPLGKIQEPEIRVNTSTNSEGKMIISDPLVDLSISCATDSTLTEPIKPATYSFTGFYKDTLEPESSGPSSPQSDSEAGLMIVDEQCEQLAAQNKEIPSEAETTEVEVTEIVSGVSKRSIKWRLSGITYRRLVDYTDIREAVLPGHTLIDPRLSFAPLERRKKCIDELGVSKGDFQELVSQSTFEEVQVDVESLQSQLINGGSLSMSDMFAAGLFADFGQTTESSVDASQSLTNSQSECESGTEQNENV